MQISKVLNIGRGVTALIGGGGKTTLMEKLACELSANGTVIMTTSTKIRRPQTVETLLDPTAEEVTAALARERIVCVASAGPEGKLSAPQMRFEELARLADYVIVEADGAKMLPLKAHLSHEPVIPENAQRVVMVIGADGFGRPIAQVCHRSALYAELAGANEQSAVTPELEARVLRAEGGFDRIYVNKVEDESAYQAAQRLAELMDCPVVAGSLHKEVYVCLS